MRLSVSFLLAALALPAIAQDDEQPIRDLWNGFVEARNRHDAKVMEGMFDAAYDSVNIRIGRVLIRSARERVETYARLFAEGQLTTTMLSNINTVRFVTPDVAIMDLEYWMQETPALKTFLTLVAVKREGRWLITAIRQSRIDQETRPNSP